MLLAAPACRPSSTTSAESEPPEAAEPKGAATAPAKGGTKPSEVPLHAHMQEHFVRVDQLQKAVVAGDLAAAKKHARWVLEHEPHADLPDGWEPFVAAMRAESKKVVDADGLDPIARATARVAGTCGSCHAAAKAEVSLGIEPEPEMGGGIALAMQKHQWAADRMWDAVVSRSDRLWVRGAEALAESEITPADLEGEPSQGSELSAVLAQFEALKPEAEAAKTPEERVDVLGAYLSTCLGCHSVIEKGPTAW